MANGFVPTFQTEMSIASHLEPDYVNLRHLRRTANPSFGHDDVGSSALADDRLVDSILVPQREANSGIFHSTAVNSGVFNYTAVNSDTLTSTIHNSAVFRDSTLNSGVFTSTTIGDGGLDVTEISYDSLDSSTLTRGFFDSTDFESDVFNSIYLNSGVSNSSYEGFSGSAFPMPRSEVLLPVWSCSSIDSVSSKGTGCAESAPDNGWRSDLSDTPSFGYEAESIGSVDSLVTEPSFLPIAESTCQPIAESTCQPIAESTCQLVDALVTEPSFLPIAESTCQPGAAVTSCEDMPLREPSMIPAAESTRLDLLHPGEADPRLGLDPRARREASQAVQPLPKAQARPPKRNIFARLSMRLRKKRGKRAEAQQPLPVSPTAADDQDQDSHSLSDSSADASSQAEFSTFVRRGDYKKSAKWRDGLLSLYDEHLHKDILQLRAEKITNKFPQVDLGIGDYIAEFLQGEQTTRVSYTLTPMLKKKLKILAHMCYLRVDDVDNGVKLTKSRLSRFPKLMDILWIHTC